MTARDLAYRATFAARRSVDGTPELVITTAVLLTAALLAVFEWLIKRGLDWLFPANGAAPGPARRLALRLAYIDPAIRQTAKARGVTITADEHRALAARMEAGIVTTVAALTAAERDELKASDAQ